MRVLIAVRERAVLVFTWVTGFVWFFIERKLHTAWDIRSYCSICLMEIRDYFLGCRSQWPCGLRRGSTAARLLGLWVRTPPRAWMFVSCECCVLSGRGLCDGLITRPEESYRVWYVWVWVWSLANEGGLPH
jgi:hypothetical protein